MAIRLRHLPVDDSGREGRPYDVGLVTIGIPQKELGAGVHIQEPQLAGYEPGLLEQFTPRGLVEAFAQLQRAAWQAPQAIIGTALEQKCTVGRLDDDTGRNQQEWTTANELAHLCHIVGTHGATVPPSARSSISADRAVTDPFRPQPRPDSV